MLATGTAQANTIYKYVDKDGHVTFTNIPQRGAKPFLVTPPSESAAPPAKASPDTPGQPALRASPPSGNVPSIRPETQRTRDRGRHRILQDELSNEQKALTDARKALASASTASPEQKRKLQDEITDRERNINALQNELGMANAPK